MVISGIQAKSWKTERYMILKIGFKFLKNCIKIFALRFLENLSIQMWIHTCAVMKKRTHHMIIFYNKITDE